MVEEKPGLPSDFIKEELMVANQPNPEVVRQMADEKYRLNVLRQILTKRFLAIKVNMQSGADLLALDAALRAEVESKFNQPLAALQDSPGGNDGALTGDQANSLYLDLALNQQLLVNILANK